MTNTGETDGFCIVFAKGPKPSGYMIVDESSIVTNMEVTGGFGIAVAKGPSLGIRSWKSPQF